jgi:uncharacterized GH25 family protein
MVSARFLHGLLMAAMLFCCAYRRGDAAPVETPADRRLPTFDLRVVGSNGNGLPGIEIEVRTTPKLKAEQVREGIFDRRSRYGCFVKANTVGRVLLELPANTKRFEIFVESPGYAPYWASWDRERQSEQVPTEFTATLDAAWSVGSLVVDEAGKPVEGVRIGPSIEFKKPPGDQRQLAVGTRLGTNARGIWTFDSVPESQNEVFVEINHPNFMPDRRPLPRSVFGIERGRVPAAKIVLKRGLTLTGKVTDDKGKPIEGAVIRTKFLNDLRKASTGVDGVYRLPGCEPRVTRVVVSAKGHATDMREVRVEPDMEPVDFQMQPGRTVRVRVIDAYGKPIPKARIFFQEWRGQFQYFEFDNVSQYANEQGVWEWNEAPLDAFQADICRPNGMQLNRQRLIARKEEYVFRPPPALVIFGTVIDAETKRPIKSFRVIPGTRFDATQMIWNRSGAFRSSDGHYRLAETYGSSAHLIRIEADGYQPAVSRDVKSDEGNVSINFELTKGKDFVATVLTPDGLPAAKAQVAIATAGTQIIVKNGRITPGLASAAMQETDASGRFHFAPQEPPFLMLILHSSGYAQFEPARESKRRIINLDPWSRVEGTFRIGKQPQANVELWINHFSGTFFNERGPKIFFEYEVTTNADGHFVFDRVIAGRGSVGRRILLMLNEGATTVTSSAMVSATFPLGKTVHADIGGSGRPLVGKLRWLEGQKRDIPWSFLLVQLRPGTSGLQHELNFSASVDRNGAFRIDDVPPGEYTLGFMLVGRPSGLRLKDRHISVPPIANTSSDQPFDLGTHTLEKY